MPLLFIKTCNHFVCCYRATYKYLCTLAHLVFVLDVLVFVLRNGNRTDIYHFTPRGIAIVFIFVNYWKKIRKGEDNEVYRFSADCPYKRA